MNKELIINNAVNNAYNSLKSIVDIGANICGGYLSVIIPSNDFNSLIIYADEIINRVFWKFCNEISSNIKDNEAKLILYRPFSLNNADEKLIDDCFNIINNIVINKKYSEDTTLFSLLDSLKENYNTEELEESFDLIFDILLSYDSAINK